MPPRTPGLLWDMLNSARLIVSWTSDMDESMYEQDIQLQSAVERRFEIIGEAARRLTHHDPATASLLLALPQIISFRNLIAHGYDEIDHRRVWTIIRDFLPDLVTGIETLLASRSIPENQ